MKVGHRQANIRAKRPVPHAKRPGVCVSERSIEVIDIRAVSIDTSGRLRRFVFVDQLGASRAREAKDREVQRDEDLDAIGVDDSENF